jgi:hypothetical protein
MLWTAPRRVECLSLVECSSARRVGRQIYEQAVVKAKAGSYFIAGYFQTSIRHHPLGGGGRQPAAGTCHLIKFSASLTQIGVSPKAREKTFVFSCDFVHSGGHEVWQFILLTLTLGFGFCVSLFLVIFVTDPTRSFGLSRHRPSRGGSVFGICDCWVRSGLEPSQLFDKASVNVLQNVAKCCITPAGELEMAWS